jgi:hypothetical protein
MPKSFVLQMQYPWPTQSVQLDRSRYAEFAKTVPDQWFAVTPYPDNWFVVAFKAGEVPSYLADEVAPSIPPVPTEILTPPEMSAAERSRIDIGVLSRVLLERRLLWNLIAYLQQCGFKPKCVRHDEDITAATADAMLKEATAVDEAMVIFTNKDGEYRWLQLVFGNSGWDLVSDWGCPRDESDGWDAALNTFTDNTERFIL